MIFGHQRWFTTSHWYARIGASIVIVVGSWIVSTIGGAG